MVYNPFNTPSSSRRPPRAPSRGRGRSFSPDDVAGTFADVVRTILREDNEEKKSTRGVYVNAASLYTDAYSIKMGPRQPKKFKAIAQSCVFENQSQTLEQLVTGLSGLWDLFPCMTLPQMIGPTQTAVTDTVNNNEAWPCGIFSLNPDHFLGGNMIDGVIPPQSGIGVGGYYASAYVTHVDYEMQFHNGTDIPQEVYVYALTPKVELQSGDEGYSPAKFVLKAIEHQTQSNKLVQPTDTLGTGFDVGTMWPNTYGQSPFELKEMRDVYQIKKKNRYILQPGATVRSHVRIYYNRYFSYRNLSQKFAQKGTDKPVHYLPFTTVWFMAHVKPAPVFIKENVEKQLNYTPGPIKVGVLRNMKVYVKYPKPHEQTFQQYFGSAAFVKKESLENVVHLGLDGQQDDVDMEKTTS